MKIAENYRIAANPQGKRNYSITWRRCRFTTSSTVWATTAMIAGLPRFADFSPFVINRQMINSVDLAGNTVM